MAAETPPAVLDSRVAYRGRIFETVVETIQLATLERPVTVEVVRHAPSVGIAAMPTDDSVMLVRQYRHALGVRLWELPAGSVDDGERAEDAARRECHEELGLVAGELENLGTLIPLPGYCTEEMTFFKVTGLRAPTSADPDAHQDEDEDIEPLAFSLSEIRQMIGRGEIRDMKTVAVLALLGR
jgi:8-oxo-dGTP pyrophosphatase MutT (NUDIX family)